VAAAPSYSALTSARTTRHGSAASPSSRSGPTSRPTRRPSTWRSSDRGRR
jgi:hypothetical protein